jgi:hypothetical protein
MLASFARLHLVILAPLEQLSWLRTRNLLPKVFCSFKPGSSKLSTNTANEISERHLCHSSMARRSQGNRLLTCIVNWAFRPCFGDLEISSDLTPTPPKVQVC